MDAVALQLTRNALPDSPEIRQGLVVPQGFPVCLLIQITDAILCMLGRDVQRNLCQIQVGPDTAGGGNTELLPYIRHDGLA